jgi:hypothetical protein
MGDLASLHAQARRLIVALRSGLDRLEAQEGVGGTLRAIMCSVAQCIRGIAAACAVPAANREHTVVRQCQLQMPKSAASAALAKDMQSKLLELQVANVYANTL